jgi:hypothetical protein
VKISQIKMVKKSQTPRKANLSEAESVKNIKSANAANELRLRTPKGDDSSPERSSSSPRDLEKAGAKQSVSPSLKKVVVDTRNSPVGTSQNSYRHFSIQRNMRSVFFRVFLVLLLGATLVVGIMWNKQITSFVSNSSDASANMRETWTPAPFLSEQTFTFASTVPYETFDRNGFVNFLMGKLKSFPNDVIQSSELSFSANFNNTNSNITIVNLQFKSYYFGSNNFRDAIIKILPRGALAQYGVVGFGEGRQIPRDFCESDRFGIYCKKCSVCDSRMVCDSGTMGSGKCGCPAVFVTDPYFQGRGAQFAANRCISLSNAELDGGKLSVEIGESSLRTIRIENVGSQNEQIAGISISGGSNVVIEESLAQYFVIHSQHAWPVLLLPGESIEVIISFELNMPVKMDGIMMIYVDNVPLEFYDDVVMAIPLIVEGTIGGKSPRNGIIEGIFPLYNIDCGSRTSNDWKSKRFFEDSWFLGDSNAIEDVNPATKAVPSVLRSYRTFRNTNGVHYSFPVNFPGQITIRFTFAELYRTQMRERTFFIQVNGVRTSSEPIDVFASAGAIQKEFVHEFILSRQENMKSVDIRFESVTGVPFVGAIEIEQYLNISVVTFLKGISGSEINYAEALHKAYIFFDVMQSGNSSNRLKWRGDSCLNCKGPNGQDLSGGFYEAGGNYLKVTFPMAWTMSMVGYGLLEHKTGHIYSNQYEIAQKHLKWGLDFLMKSRIDDSRMVLSIGAAVQDFSYYGPPEFYDEYISSRPVWLFSANDSCMSSETAGEISAALAIGSLVFRESNPGYSAKLVSDAVQAYNFATSFKGSYMDGKAPNLGFQEIRELYPSSSYVDELAWGAAWLYRATNESKYLDDARNYYMQNQISLNHGCGWSYSWDEKGPILHVLLSKIDPDETRKSYYDSRATEYFNQYLPGKYRSIPHTPKGLAYPSLWGSARYAGNTGYISMLYSRYLNERNAGTERFRNALKSYGQLQIDYILGKFGRSMMAGMGIVSPQYLLHKSSYTSILYFKNRPKARKDIYSEFIFSTYPQVHIPYGAVIGGPVSINNQPSDYYIDARNYYQYTEPGLDYSGCITAGIAALAEENKVTPISDNDLDLGNNFVPPRP